MSNLVIYKIRNLVNQKFYVGSSQNKRERFRNHRRLLRLGTHHCKHLQAAWNKYTEECFVFEVVEEVPEGGDLWSAEDRWLDEHFGKPYCYNAGRSADAPMRGRVGPLNPKFGTTMPEAQRAAISDTLTALWAEHPERHPRLGTAHTDGTKEAIRQEKLANPTRAWLGKERSEETKAKISAAQKGRANPRKGLTMSEQGRLNVAAAVKRGEESHFFGQRPVNADDLQKTVYVRKADGTLGEFPSLSYLRDTLGVSVATTIRACRSGKPVKVGATSGWVMSYEPLPESAIHPEYAHLPRTRQLAKEQGAAMYFTGAPCSSGHLAPRKVQGVCVECAKLSGAKSNEVRKAKPKSEAAKEAGRRYYEKKKLAALKAA